MSPRRRNALVDFDPTRDWIFIAGIALAVVGWSAAPFLAIWLAPPAPAAPCANEVRP